jgi:hypothetical protein
MAASRLNWEAIKAEYIAGDESVTQRSLAAKYRVNFATVGRRASKEHWAEARSAYRQQVASKTLNRVSTTEAEFRARQLRIARAMEDIGLRVLLRSEPQSFSEALRTVIAGMEQERKAAGIAERHELDIDLNKLTDEELLAIAKGGGPT